MTIDLEWITVAHSCTKEVGGGDNRLEMNKAGG